MTASSTTTTTTITTTSKRPNSPPNTIKAATAAAVDKDKDSNAHRLRENQRRSRLRKKEYLASLEARFRDCQRTGIEASVEIQNAAKRVVRENQRLRGLLRLRGVTDSEVESWVRSGDLSNDGCGGELTPVEAVEKALRRRPCNAEPLDNPDSSKDLGRRKSTGMVNETSRRASIGGNLAVRTSTTCGESSSSNTNGCGTTITRLQPQPQPQHAQQPRQLPPHELSPLSSSASTASFSPLSPTNSSAPSNPSYVVGHNLPSTAMHSSYPAHSQPGGPVFASVPETQIEHHSMYSLTSGPSNHSMPAYATQSAYYHHSHHHQHHGQHGQYIPSSAPAEGMHCDMLEQIHPPNSVGQMGREICPPDNNSSGCVVQNGVLYGVMDRMG